MEAPAATILGFLGVIARATINPGILCWAVSVPAADQPAVALTRSAVAVPVSAGWQSVNLGGASDLAIICRLELRESSPSNYVTGVSLMAVRPPDMSRF